MRLPPLNALRAFEAAARHEGFIGAAEELHVTRGAISRHVRQLEDHLGTALFTRQAKGVRLTVAGRRLLPVLTEAFGMIAREVERVVPDRGELRVICPPATSIRWLIPKLEDFQARHPDIRLRLTTDFHGDLGFDTGEYDIGFSVEHWTTRPKGIAVQVLLPVMLTPACSPAYLSGADLTAPEDLSRCMLLHETPGHADWTAWAERFGVRAVEAASGSDFPNLDMATKAAVMGAGVVMADLVLCREELESGALIAPFPQMVCPSPQGGICLLGHRDRWQEPKIAAFRAWAEAAARDADGLSEGATRAPV